MSAQAISVSVPAGRSVWRALLWKEWRQQRWVALPLAALPTVLFVGIYFLTSHRWQELAALGLSSLAAVVSPLIVGANAFCGERDDQSDEFLCRMPLGGLQVFVLKVALVWAISLLTILLLGATVYLFSRNADFRHIRPDDVAANLLKVSIFQMLLGLLPALASAWAVRTLPDIMLSLAAGTGTVAWTLWNWRLFMGMLQYQARWSSNRVGRLPGELLTFMPIVTVVAIVLTSAPFFWIWSRTHRSASARTKKGALVLSLLLVLPALPTMYHYAYYTFIASPQFFYSEKYPAPNGERIAAACAYIGWGRSEGERAAIVDVNTGEWHWLTRFRKSFPYYRGWSPSGKRLAWLRIGPVIPFQMHSLDTAMFSICIYDAATGKSTELKDIAPSNIDLKRIHHMGWVNDDMPVFVVNNNEVVFTSLTKGEMWRSGEFQKGMNANFVTPRGVFAYKQQTSPDGKEAIKISRLAPDLLQPEDFTITLPDTGDPNSAWADFRISPNGLWAAAQDNSNPIAVLIFPIKAGATPVKINLGAMGRQAQSTARIFDFSANGEKLLMRSERQLVVHDLLNSKTQAFDVCPEDQPSAYISYASISPSGSHVISMISSPPSRLYHILTDLATGETKGISIPGNYHYIKWVDDDWLLLRGDDRLISRDGTKIKPLFRD